MKYYYRINREIGICNRAIRAESVAVLVYLIFGIVRGMVSRASRKGMGRDR